MVNGALYPPATLSSQLKLGLTICAVGLASIGVGFSAPRELAGSTPRVELPWAGADPESADSPSRQATVPAELDPPSDNAALAIAQQQEPKASTQGVTANGSLDLNDVPMQRRHLVQQHDLRVDLAMMARLQRRVLFARPRGHEPAPDPYLASIWHVRWEASD